ncbi:MAG: nicotinate-nucleotide adenylyltransferase [Bacillota bacterium]|nr:nicotinate-nucleotide adenylyltransferase [Bacillota bacterium]
MGCSKKGCVGIMGGTFNPIHHGHLLLAEQVRTEYGLDCVLFIPSGHPPHKALAAGNPSGEQRLEMTRCAVEDNEHFSVSDIEVRRPGASYTIDTIRELQAKYPEREFVFITGADVILELDLWRNHEELLKMIRFVAAARPGTELSAVIEKIKALKERYDASIDLIEISALAISSTEIRERVSAGKSIRYLVPDAVEEFIRSNDLYRPHHPDYEKLYRVMRERLSPHRFAHSVSVARTARDLAARHGADPLRAELAGLVHDYAKEMANAESVAWIERFRIEPKWVFQSNPNLAHAEIGAFLLQQDGLVTDEEVLEAVRWHTYGRPGMSLLSKIVYIADAIEPGRRLYEGLIETRRAVLESIDEAILVFGAFQKDYLAEKGDVLHPNTEALIKEIEENR